MRIKKTHKKFLILIPIILIILIFVAAIGKSHNKPKVAMQTVMVKRGTVLASVSGNGVLQPVTTVEVKSNVAGKVIKLAVDEGDRVKAGQLIAKIDPSTSESNLEQAQADYSSARSKVDQARQNYVMQRVQTAANIQSAQQSLVSTKEKFEQASLQSKMQPKLTSESIKQAQSSLSSAEATLKQTKSASVPQKIASAKASYEGAKATYEKAEKDLARNKALLGKGFVSKSDVDDYEAQYSSAKAQMESAKEKLDTIKDESDQDLKGSEAQVAQAKAALESAYANSMEITLKKKDLSASRAAMKQAISALSSAQASAYQDQMKKEELLQADASLSKASAALKNAKTDLGYTIITAPRDGVVVKKYTEEGSIVSAGSQANAGSGSGVTIVDIADISKMQVQVDVDESDIAKIRKGQGVDVSLDAYPDRTFKGKVIKIAPEAEVTSNVTTVPVTVELDNTKEELKPEMSATCDFVINRKENVLCVPVEAVAENHSGTMVNLMDHGKMIPRNVSVGLMGDDYYEITSGLSEGDTVGIMEEDTSTSSKSNSQGPGGGGPGGPPPM